MQRVIFIDRRISVVIKGILRIWPFGFKKIFSCLKFCYFQRNFLHVNDEITIGSAIILVAETMLSFMMKDYASCEKTQYGITQLKLLKGFILQGCVINWFTDVWSYLLINSYNHTCRQNSIQFLWYQDQNANIRRIREAGNHIMCWCQRSRGRFGLINKRPLVCGNACKVHCVCQGQVVLYNVWFCTYKTNTDAEVTFEGRVTSIWTQHHICNITLLML